MAGSISAWLLGTADLVAVPNASSWSGTDGLAGKITATLGMLVCVGSVAMIMGVVRIRAHVAALAFVSVGILAVVLPRVSNARVLNEPMTWSEGDHYTHVGIGVGIMQLAAAVFLMACLMLLWGWDTTQPAGSLRSRDLQQGHPGPF